MFAIFRQGRKCSQDELGASAILTVKLDDSMGGVATQVRYLLCKKKYALGFALKE